MYDPLFLLNIYFLKEKEETEFKPVMRDPSKTLWIRTSKPPALDSGINSECLIIKLLSIYAPRLYQFPTPSKVTPYPRVNVHFITTITLFDNYVFIKNICITEMHKSALINNWFVCDRPLWSVTFHR